MNEDQTKLYDAYLQHHNAERLRLIIQYACRQNLTMPQALDALIAANLIRAEIEQDMLKEALSACGLLSDQPHQREHDEACLEVLRNRNSRTHKTPPEPPFENNLTHVGNNSQSKGGFNAAKARAKLKASKEAKV